MATLSGGFGLLAGLLSTLGLYGVIAYMVARRRNEIGLRIALGADRARVIRLVLREAMLLLEVGLVAGTHRLVGGTRRRNAVVRVGAIRSGLDVVAIALLTAIALLASYAPRAVLPR